MRLVQWLISSVICAFLASVQGASHQPQFSAVSPGKAAGDVLVLDVSSLWQKYPTQPPNSVTSTVQCQQRCALLPGCNAYAFCGRPAGCGKDCKAYTSKHPALQAVTPVTNKRGELTGQAGQPQIPVNSFGPYVPDKKTAGCDGRDGDRWAFGTCTLLSNATAWKVLAAAEGTGWSSSWLTTALPTPCTGLSAQACAACHGTTHPDVCLACMKDKRTSALASGVSLIADNIPMGSSGGRALDQCVSCAQLGPVDLQRRCVSCVLDSAACSSCVPYPGAATQVKLSAVGGCIDCVKHKGKRFTGTCLTCSVTTDPAKCFACLAKFYPSMMCKTSTYVDCYKPDYDNPCASCQNGADYAYNSCIECYQNPAAKPDCDFCSDLADEKSQLPCYSCSKQSQTAHSNVPGGCGLCFAHSKDARTHQECIECVVSNRTAQGNKQHCHLCASIDFSPQQAAQCYKCLGSPGGSPDCSTCAQAAVSEAAFSSCMMCYSNSNNGPDCDECSGLLPFQGDVDPKRTQCYQCVTSSKLIAPKDAGFAPLGSCAACFSSKGDPAACIACNINSQTSVAAKSWCNSCSSIGDVYDVAKRSTCFACLESKLKQSMEYRTKCGLSR